MCQATFFLVRPIFLKEFNPFHIVSDLKLSGLFRVKCCYRYSQCFRVVMPQHLYLITCTDQIDQIRKIIYHVWNVWKQEVSKEICGLLGNLCRHVIDGAYESSTALKTVIVGEIRDSPKNKIRQLRYNNLRGHNNESGT